MTGFVLYIPGDENLDEVLSSLKKHSSLHGNVEISNEINLVLGHKIRPI